jgi:hypothetical protein
MFGVFNGKNGRFLALPNSLLVNKSDGSLQGVQTSFGFSTTGTDNKVGA